MGNKLVEAPAQSPQQPSHPRCERFLVGIACGMGGKHVAAVGFSAILADLELAFDAGNWNPKPTMSASMERRNPSGIRRHFPVKVGS